MEYKTVNNANIVVTFENGITYFEEPDTFFRIYIFALHEKNCEKHKYHLTSLRHISRIYNNICFKI